MKFFFCFLIIIIFLSCTKEIKNNGNQLLFIKPGSDVRYVPDMIKKIDMTKVTNLNEDLLKSLWFNKNTDFGKWNSNAEKVMIKGMNPGLGIRELHKQGITGKGVNVAIIDQNLASFDHPEYKDKIIKYRDLGCDMPTNSGSMHGPAVLSLLVGKNCGTAPDSRVYYAAVPSWKSDTKVFSEALYWIIKENESLPNNNRIRVVSLSGMPGIYGNLTNNNDLWEKALRLAEKNNILVLDATLDNGFIFECSYDYNEPENILKVKTPVKNNDFTNLVRSYVKWINNTIVNATNIDIIVRHYENCLLVPINMRTQAEEYFAGKFSYQYTSKGGISWAIPYAAGVLAMGWQVNPDLSIKQMTNLLFTTAFATESGFKVINPPEFIRAVKGTVK